MKKYTIIALLACIAAKLAAQAPNLAVEPFRRLISDPEVILLDVRTPAEFAAGHIRGTDFNIDVQQEGFVQQVQRQIPKDKEIAVYCRSGRRSRNAAEALVAAGYKVTNLDAGFLSWSENLEWGVVNVSSAFLRARPDYESPLESQSLMGTILQIMDSDRYWRKVVAPDYKNVWTNELSLALMSEREKNQYLAAEKWICTAKYSSLLAEPHSDAAQLADFTMGNIVRKSSSSAQGAFVAVLMADGTEAWVKDTDVEDFKSWARSRKVTEEGLVAMAKTMLGTPYMWGGNTVKHYDCSGLTKTIYLMHGIVLPRNAREQIACGVSVPYELGKMRPGDLIFYGRKDENGKPVSVSHVSMYIGDGKIIHSSQLVRVNSIVKGEPNYYDRQAIEVRRIIGNVNKGAKFITADPAYFQQ
ncbi:MAG: C40 family peptidase [Bacteroidales bacterium]|nr:C40 family peptidase [Bacteroidales bacterium]